VDCHYIDANRWTQRRMDKLWDTLEKLDIRPERLQLEWISAAEGKRWMKTMVELEIMRQQVTPEEVEHTMKVLEERRLKAEMKAAKKQTNGDTIKTESVSAD